MAFAGSLRPWPAWSYWCWRSRERSVELLPGGHALMKSVDSVRDARGFLASYTWRLGRAESGRHWDLAVFRLRLPLEAAGEVIAQADLATLDREVREAEFTVAPPPKAV